MATSEVTGVTTGQPNLVKQDLSTLDVSKLSAVSKEVISRQATINIGTIGHVAHGKSTVVKAVSGVQTVRFKNELERNITIKLDKNRKSMGQWHSKNKKSNNIDENVHIGNGLINNTDSGDENHTNFESTTKETTLNIKPINNDRKLRVRNKPTEENILKNILENVKRRRSTEFAEDEEKFEPPKKKLRKAKRLCNQIAIDDISTTDCFDIVEEKTNEKETVQRQNETTVEQTRTIDCSLELTNGTKTNEITTFEENSHANSTDSVVSTKTYAMEPKVIISPLSSKDLISYKNTKRNTYKDEYIVENIIAQKVDKEGQLFLVKWKGWSDVYNSWEPLAHLGNCSLILAQFLKKEYKSRHEELAKLRCELTSPENLTRSALEALMKEPGTLMPPDEIELTRSLIALLDTPIEERDSLETSRVTRLICLSELHKKRNEQLELLKKWENEINTNGTMHGTVRVENNVDLEMPPQKFIYTNDYVPGKGVTIPNDPPIGCECKTCNFRSKNCCAEQGGGFCYDYKKLIKVAPGAPVYECNKRCKCDKSCQNRVVQNGGTVPLCIFRTDNGRGWGVKAERRIPTGKFICMYVGEVILFEEAERRGQVYDAMGRTYLFDLDFNSSDHPYTVDAATYGNISHFINHSCDPNLGVWATWIDCLDPNLPSLALFAKRDIEKDEELTFDYMARSTSEPANDLPAATDANSTKQRVRLDLPENERESLATRTRCKCGAQTCRQYLF